MWAFKHIKNRGSCWQGELGFRLQCRRRQGREGLVTTVCWRSSKVRVVLLCQGRQGGEGLVTTVWWRSSKVGVGLQNALLATGQLLLAASFLPMFWCSSNMCCKHIFFPAQSLLRCCPSGLGLGCTLLHTRPSLALTHAAVLQRS